MPKIDRRRKAVLIVECDSGTLTRQNLAMGEQLYAFVKVAFPSNPVELLRVDREADLLEQMAELHKAGKPYRSIVIIGHSSRDGLQIAADRFTGWEAVANWFRPFEPHRVILLACEAGRRLPCAALFDRLPNLQEVFASPVPARKNQIHFILFRVLYALGAKKENKELLRLAQGVNFLATNGLMLKHTRRDYECDGEMDSAVWEAAELFLDQIMGTRQG